jgi:membrane associated rhomboid family serine protease
MFFAIPHDELSAERLPWVTWSLAGLWVVAGLAALFGLDPQASGLGVDPGALGAKGFAAHWLFHESAVHALVSLLLLLALGPHLEEAFGKRIYAGFLAGAMLAAAGVHALLGSEGRPLVGASGALMALIAALLVRHGTGSAHTYVLAWWREPLRLSFELPVYTALIAWFVGEVLMTLTASGTGPTRGIGSIPLAGAVFGVGVAMALRGSLPQAGSRPAVERAHPALAAALAAREAGRPGAAVSALEPAVRARPQDAELLRALCDAAVAAGEGSRAVEPLRRFLSEQLRLGETAAAVGFWRAFGTRLPGVRLDPRSALGLAEGLAAAGDKALAARLLRDALAASPRMSPGVALRFAEVAAPLHRETAIRAGKIALAAEGLDEAKRAKLAERVARLEASAPTPEPDLDALTRAPEAGPEAEVAAPPAHRPGVRADRSIDVELDPLYAPIRPSELPPPEPEPEAAFELSADGSMVQGGNQDLAGGLPDTAPIMLAPSDADDAEPAPEFGAMGDLASEDPIDPAASPASLPVSAPRAASRPTSLPPPPPLPPAPPAPVPRPAPAAAAPEPVPQPAAQPDAEGVAASVAADEPRFHELKCIEAVPVALDESGLALRNGPQLDLARVDGIAVGAVQGLAAKPVILIDLLLNWTEISDAPLRTVRLRSDQFDPRTLFPGNGGGGLDAFRALLEALLARAGATPLPDAASARGRPFKMYAELARYEREVLQVER